MKKLILSLAMLTFIANPVLAQHSHQDRPQTVDLQAVPANLPDWIYNKGRNHIYRQRGIYNDSVYQVKALALDLNAIAVGHAFAYEDIVTGKANELETKTFEKINWVLKNPPAFMPDEANISPTFGRKYGVLEQVFDWTHIFHAQTVDVLASTKLTEAQKEAEIEKLYQFYRKSVPYALTGLPMNMGYLDSQPYSKAFRQKYPKVNGLFWGYHWLQGSMYDLLYGKTLAEQRKTYQKVGQQYHQQELYRTDRAFMPMFAELSPNFARRFPHIANIFDNLHMLHDMVNDILASDWMTPQQKDEQITRAIWLVMANNHEGMESGKNYGGDGLHDHRFSHEGQNHNPNPNPTETKPPTSTGQESPNPTETKPPTPTGHEGHNPTETKPPTPTGHEGHNPTQTKPPTPEGQKGNPPQRETQDDEKKPDHRGHQQRYKP